MNKQVSIYGNEISYGNISISSMIDRENSLKQVQPFRNL